jgi:hypothetical protein
MKIKIIPLVAAVAVAGFTQAASAMTFPATAGLFIVDNSTSTTSYVPVSGGVATFAGTFDANWSLVITTGQTVVGGAHPSLDLDVAATHLAGTGTLSIYYSDIGFGPTVANYVLSTFLSSGGPVTTSAYLSAANTAFGMTTSLGGTTDATGNSTTINATGGINNSGPYSLTIVDLIGGNVTSMDTSLKVPDGGTTAMLLGASLSGLALLRRKLAA